MTAMRAADRGDAVCVPRGCEPVLDDRANPPTFDRRFARAVVARNEQHQPVSACDGLLEHSINRSPCGIKVHAVEVEHTVGLDIAALEFFLPASIEGLVANPGRPGAGSSRASRNPGLGRAPRLTVRWIFKDFCVHRIPRQRPNRRRDAGP